MADEKQTKYIFGIDLGTTYSVISYLDDNIRKAAISRRLLSI